MQNIKKIKTGELGINGLISWTRRTKNISKNQNLYPHQSRITFQIFAMRYPVRLNEIIGIFI